MRADLANLASIRPHEICISLTGLAQVAEDGPIGPPVAAEQSPSAIS